MLYILNKILNGRSVTDLSEKKKIGKSLSSECLFLPTMKQNTLLLLHLSIHNNLTGLRKRLNLVTLPDIQFWSFVLWWYWYCRCNMWEVKHERRVSRRVLTTVSTWACKGAGFCSWLVGGVVCSSCYESCHPFQWWGSIWGDKRIRSCTSKAVLQNLLTHAENVLEIIKTELDSNDLDVRCLSVVSCI